VPLDLSPWSHGGVVSVRAHERTIGGEAPGTVVRCVLEIEFRDGSSELRELDLGEGGFATAAFEVWLRELNLALRRKHP